MLCLVQQGYRCVSVGRRSHGHDQVSRPRKDYNPLVAGIKRSRAHSEELQDIRLVVDTIPALVWSTRPDGSAEFFNQHWLEYTGLSLEQALGWGWKVTIHADDLPDMLEIFYEALSLRRAFEVEGRFRRSDGEYRWFLFRGSPLLDESGNVIRWFGTNTDLEERKRAEDALRASEQNFRRIVDGIPAPTVTFTAHGEVEYTNQRTLDYTGWTFDQLKHWGPLIHPDDLPIVQTLWKHSIETGQRFEVEQRIRDADGVFRWFVARAIPGRDVEGRIVRWYAMLFDIDGRKRAEEALLAERTRIAGALHDTLLQSFHALLFRFQAARNMVPTRPEQAMKALDAAILRTEEAIAESRDAIKHLRAESVVRGDLAELLASTGQDLAAPQTAVDDSPTFRVIVEGEPRSLGPILLGEVYCIARELLRNAFQHAKAHHIEAEIRYDNHLFSLRVRDDGKGIDPTVLKEGVRAGHWGLPGVRERAERIGARLDFWSEAGAGTEVQLTVPAGPAHETGGDIPGFGLFR